MIWHTIMSNALFCSPRFNGHRKIVFDGGTAVPRRRISGRQTTTAMRVA